MNTNLRCLSAVVAASLWIVTSGCTYASDREPETYVIPEGFVGQFYLVFNISGGQEQEYEGDSRLYRIPDSGFLLMQSDPNGGWIESDRIRFFYVSEDGERTEIDGRWSGTIHDTPDNRSDNELRILGGGSGEFQILDTCHLRYQTYYVGSVSQALDEQGIFDLFSERGIYGVDENILKEACSSETQ
ncbi:DUF6843 domain-containing protein [Marinobacter sp. M1N3S26]|uniref:DUF6843 domain-containing protein n=1 Tax=Marinobacter sp. M1N3S26 TaxID=3382299 RepID=UPI00387AC381